MEVVERVLPLVPACTLLRARAAPCPGTPSSPVGDSNLAFAALLTRGCSTVIRPALYQAGVCLGDLAVGALLRGYLGRAGLSRASWDGGSTMSPIVDREWKELVDALLRRQG